MDKQLNSKQVIGKELEQDTFALAPGSNSQLLSEHKFRVGIFGKTNPTIEDSDCVKLRVTELLSSYTDFSEGHKWAQKPTLVTGLMKGIGKEVCNTAIYLDAGIVAFLPRPIIHIKKLSAGSSVMGLGLLAGSVVDLGNLEDRDPDEVYHNLITSTGSNGLPTSKDKGAVLSSFGSTNSGNKIDVSAENLVKFISDIVSYSDCFMPYGLGPDRESLSNQSGNPKLTRDQKLKKERDSITFKACLLSLSYGKPVFVDANGNDTSFVDKYLKPVAPKFVHIFEEPEELKLMLDHMQDMLKGRAK